MKRKRSGKEAEEKQRRGGREAEEMRRRGGTEEEEKRKRSGSETKQKQNGKEACWRGNTGGLRRSKFSLKMQGKS